MWLGIASVLCCGLFAGIPAVYVGSRALSDIAASHGRLKGKGTAWVGIVLGVLGILGMLGGGAVWSQSDSCDRGGSISRHAPFC
jgi:hypothetical protein